MRSLPSAVLLCVVALLGVAHGTKPMDLPCVTWQKLSSFDPTPNIETLFSAGENNVKEYSFSRKCFDWGNIIPCFASEVGTWGHHDYAHSMNSDYCRTWLNGRVHYAESMYIPVKGPQWKTWKWKLTQKGAAVPDNAIRFGPSVMARSVQTPSGQCSAVNFTGWAVGETNGTFGSVHFSLVNGAYTTDVFEVAVCEAYHPNSTTGQPSPVPTPTTTQVPVPPPPPPTQTTTEAPPTTAVPAPPSNSLTLVSFITECLYSTHCNQASDDSCQHTLYEEGKCYQGYTYTCENSYVQQIQYDDPKCTSGASPAKQFPLTSCQQAPDRSFGSVKCLSVPIPVSGATLTHVHGCQNSCSSSNCETEYETTGQCRTDSTGSGEIPNCFPDFVAWTKYEFNDCSGTPKKMVAQPRGTCVETTSYSFFKNTC